MTKQYLDECARLHAVTGGVEGVYEDPENKDMLVLYFNGTVLSVPKKTMDKLKQKIGARRDD